METPLVSVVVITYNSSKYILECLDSIYNQTYQNIELIITDDCSKDNTVEICRQWLVEKSNRFVETKLVTTDVNSGVSGNCNRGVRETKGEWIKILAGDDMFLPNACADVVANTTQEMEAIVTQFYSFRKGNEGIIIDCELPDSKIDFFFDGSVKFQLKSFFRIPVVITPGVFFRHTIYDKVGLFDEDYPMFEDIPFFLNILDKGIKFYKLQIPCVMYRVDNSSLSHLNNNVFNLKFKKSSMDYARIVAKKYFRWWNFTLYQSWLMKRIEYYVITKWLDNKRTTLSNYVSNCCYFLSLSTYYNKIFIWYYNLKN